MSRARWILCALLFGLVAAPPAAQARGLGLDLWTDRGKDAVYEPGEAIDLKVRGTDDGYLLVYDIDSEGYVRVLYPYEGGSGFIAGRHNYLVPPQQSGMQLVVQDPVGQGYIVGILSRAPFADLPWYLRPYDPQAENVGYVGEAQDEEGILADGRIVGDPFVAMERIRRRVLRDASDGGDFATTYVSYYVHQAVRYPRYLCNDCHRPGRWAWWDGWDPYYTSCSAFDFRVYWGWYWGPAYWYGTVPYYCYVPRCYPCDPYSQPWYSAWNGWNTWNGLWSGHLVRYKSPPPPGYTPPGKYNWDRGARPMPPGFIAADAVRGGGLGGVRRLPAGGNNPGRDERNSSGLRPRAGGSSRPGDARPGVSRGPASPSQRDEGGVRFIRPGGQQRPTPGAQPRDERPGNRVDGSRRSIRSQEGQRGPYYQPRGSGTQTPRYESPSSRPSSRPRDEGSGRPASPPRYESPSSRPSTPPPSSSPPRRDSEARPSSPPSSPPSAPAPRPAAPSGGGSRPGGGGGRWR